jgi:hypothetical protein
LDINPVDKISLMWQKCRPKLLAIEGSPDQCNLADDYRALKIIEKKLKPNGARSKVAGAFAINPVRFES